MASEDGTGLRGDWHRALLLCGLLAFVLVLSLFRIRCFDVWTHLTVGRYIACERRIPSTNMFAFTEPNHPWVAQQWLFQVGAYGVERLLGVAGLITVKSVIVAATFAMLWAAMAAGRINLHLAVPILILAAYAARFRFLVRPGIVFYLFVSTFFLILTRHRRGRPRALLLLPLIQLVWANAHGSAMMGVLLTLLWVGCEGARTLCRSWAGERGGCWPATLRFLSGTEAVMSAKQIRQLGLVLLVCFCVCFVNPSTYRLVILPFQSAVRLHASGLQEIFQDRLPLTWSRVAEQHRCYVVLAALGVAAFIATLKAFDLTSAAIFASFFVLSLTSERFIGIFAIATAPVIAGRLNLVLGERMRRGLRRTAQMTVSIALCVALAAAAAWHVGYDRKFHFGYGLENQYPVLAAEFLKGQSVKGNVYAAAELGAYLMWEGFEVFVDPRGPDAYSVAFFQRYLDAHFDRDLWAKMMDELAVECAVVMRPQMNYMFLSSPDWAFVHWDGVARVYVRRDSKNEEVVRRFQYREVRPYPGLSRQQYLGPLMKHEGRRVILERELRRAIQVDGCNVQARLTLARVLLHQRSYGEAQGEYERALAIDPECASARLNLGVIFAQQGELDRAAEQWRRVLEIQPDHEPARKNLRALGERYRD